MDKNATVIKDRRVGLLGDKQLQVRNKERERERERESSRER